MQETSAALIDQLVYFDNFMLNSDTPNLDLDGQLSLDLAAFADDSFIFADEDKPDPHMSDIEDDNGHNDMRHNQVPGQSSSHRALELANGPDRRENSGAFRDAAGPNPMDQHHHVANHAADHAADHDDNFPLDIHEGPGSSASHSLADPWFHQQKIDNQHTSSQGPGRNQLHSLLNDKIEATKRNKFHNHVGHINGAATAAHGQARDHFSPAPPPQQQQHEQHPQQQDQQDQPSLVSTPQPPRPEIHRQESNRDPPVLSSSTDHRIPDLTNLPKYPVPPGAESSLKKAGLSQNQIDLLSALIAQHQTSLKNDDGTQRPPEPPTREARSASPSSIVPTLISHGPTPLSQTVSTKEADQFSRVALSRQNSVVGQTQSMNASPVSNYSSEHSNGSNMSVVYSPYKDASSTNVSDANVPGQDLTKRKRNTAASARFRVKKKMKEKEMETKISQLSDMIQKFELRIDELEMENRFLKNLVIEKGNRDSDEELRQLKDKAKYVDSHE
ncbi:hypothetical protein JCM33374_g4067 [Metschnikowia sp. JCM 33374]|nr:hypothetical protein JCM33374_g4067 [Metschnikowia sp. JCM 33374]